MINDCPIAVGVENPHKFWMCRSLATLDKLVDRFPLPPVGPSIGDTSLTRVMRLAAHSTKSPTPTAMGQSFIMTLYKYVRVFFPYTKEKMLNENYYRNHLDDKIRLNLYIFNCKLQDFLFAWFLFLRSSCSQSSLFTKVFFTRAVWQKVNLTKKS
jgi:hypothetical protein